MTNLMISGFKRLLKNRAFQITAAVVAVVGLFEIFMMYRDSIIEMDTPYLDGGLFSFAALGVFALAAVVPLFVGSEYSDGTIRNKVVVGHHRGAACYTRGQRKGLGLSMGQPVYVCRKDMQRNTVTVGPGEALFSPALLAGDWNWYPFPTLTAPMRVTVKTRHSQFEQAATVYPEENGFARVEFDQPQRAVTPGQAVVLYDGDMVVGGGTITEALSR